MVTGATTGAILMKVEDLRVNLKDADICPQGTPCSVRIPPEMLEKIPGGRFRRGDKVFIWTKQEEE